jgi:hypothetical protein
MIWKQAFDLDTHRKPAIDKLQTILINENR